MLEESNTEVIRGLDVSVMFCAGPKGLVQFVGNKKDKYFYNIFCFYIEETDHYIVFVKMFKSLKRKQKNGTYFNLANSTSKVLNTKEQTYDFLNNFLNSLEEHDRFINEEILRESKINAIEAINSINQWEKHMVDYFNDLIPDTNKKNKWNLLKLF